MLHRHVGPTSSFRIFLTVGVCNKLSAHVEDNLPCCSSRFLSRSKSYVLFTNLTMVFVGGCFQPLILSVLSYLVHTRVLDKKAPVYLSCCQASLGLARHSALYSVCVLCVMCASLPRKGAKDSLSHFSRVSLFEAFIGLLLSTPSSGA
eukprot:764001-Hanusia_phi.AAC.3